MASDPKRPKSPIPASPAARGPQPWHESLLQEPDSKVKIRTEQSIAQDGPGIQRRSSFCEVYERRLSSSPMKKARLPLSHELVLRKASSDSRLPVSELLWGSDSRKTFDNLIKEWTEVTHQYRHQVLGFNKKRWTGIFDLDMVQKFDSVEPWLEEVHYLITLYYSKYPEAQEPIKDLMARWLQWTDDVFGGKAQEQGDGFEQDTSAGSLVSGTFGVFGTQFWNGNASQAEKDTEQPELEQRECGIVDLPSSSPTPSASPSPLASSTLPSTDHHGRQSQGSSTGSEPPSLMTRSFEDVTKEGDTLNLAGIPSIMSRPSEIVWATDCVTSSAAEQDKGKTTAVGSQQPAAVDYAKSARLSPGDLAKVVDFLETVIGILVDMVYIGDELCQMLLSKVIGVPDIYRSAFITARIRKNPSLISKHDADRAAYLERRITMEDDLTSRVGEVIDCIKGRLPILADLFGKDLSKHPYSLLADPEIGGPEERMMMHGALPAPVEQPEASGDEDEALRNHQNGLLYRTTRITRNLKFWSRLRRWRLLDDGQAERRFEMILDQLNELPDAAARLPEMVEARAQVRQILRDVARHWSEGPRLVTLVDGQLQKQLGWTSFDMMCLDDAD